MLPMASGRKSRWRGEGETLEVVRFIWILRRFLGRSLISFSVAARVTQGNWGTAFLLALMSMGIMILGCLALCIGFIFAAPLVTMLFTVAYLMMAGQIPVQPAYGQPGQFGQPAPKW